MADIFRATLDEDETGKRISDGFGLIMRYTTEEKFRFMSAARLIAHDKRYEHLKGPFTELCAPVIEEVNELTRDWQRLMGKKIAAMFREHNRQRGNARS